VVPRACTSAKPSTASCGSAACSADSKMRTPSAVHTCTTNSKFCSPLPMPPTAALGGRPARSDSAICCMW
jgi:hypothetical protein